MEQASKAPHPCQGGSLAPPLLSRSVSCLGVMALRPRRCASTLAALILAPRGHDPRRESCLVKCSCHSRTLWVHFGCGSRLYRTQHCTCVRPTCRGVAWSGWCDVQHWRLALHTTSNGISRYSVLPSQSRHPEPWKTISATCSPATDHSRGGGGGGGGGVSRCWVRGNKSVSHDCQVKSHGKTQLGR